MLGKNELEKWGKICVSHPVHRGYPPGFFFCIIRYANIILILSVFTFRKSENDIMFMKNLYA